MFDSARARLLAALVLVAVVALVFATVYAQSGSRKKAADAAAGKIPITTSSEAARAAFLEGRDLGEKLRGAEARAKYARAVELDPNFALALLNLSFTQPTVREFNETMARAVAASDHVSPGEKTLILAGQAAGQGDNVEQIRLLRGLVQEFPNDERAQNALGIALFATQDWAGSIGVYEAAIKIDPSYSPPYNQLGYAYRFLNRMEEAERTFKKYIEILPGDPNPYDSYAELLLKLGRYDESIAMYKKALEVSPTFVNSYTGIATNYDLKKDTKRALAESDALLAVAKDDAQQRLALFSKTVSHAFAGDYSGAQKEMDRQFEIAVTGRDTLAMIGDLVFKGNISLEQKDPAAASGFYWKAADLNDRAVSIPEANRANQRRFQTFLAGRIALAKGDLAGARAKSEQYTKEAAESGSAFQQRLSHELAGQVAIAAKEYDRAIAELSKASLVDPYNLYRLSLAYAGKGDATHEREYFDRARNDNALANLNYAFVLQRVNGRKTS